MIAGPFARQGRQWLAAAGVGLAGFGAGAFPAPPGYPDAEQAATSVYAALVSAAIVAAAILPFVLFRGVSRRRTWLLVAGTALAVGAASFLAGSYATRRCTAQYGTRPVIVGTELTELGRKYVQLNPDSSRDDILFDAAGNAGQIWTSASIDRCRALVGATYFLWIPFLVICVLAAVEAMPGGTLAAATSGPAVPTRSGEAALRYDAFISYRHGGADGDLARQVLERLETHGYRVAIDERDFAANASFLEEMERCIRESRFTIALVSPRYLESGNTQEEAILCRVLDMAERRRRLIPLIIAPTVMPAWLYGIVGIDCTKVEPLVDPMDRLRSALGEPLGARSG